MLSRFTTGFALLLAASHTVAQTSTSCDPTKKSEYSDRLESFNANFYQHVPMTQVSRPSHTPMTARHLAPTMMPGKSPQET